MAESEQASEASTHQARPLPDWYANAKLGIFVHWGLYSVPAWAPTTGPLSDAIESGNWSHWFANNPYAEWYHNSIRIPGGSAQTYHAEHFGGAPYEAFRATFESAVAAWDPTVWAERFHQAGARYVVLTTKHHDGFCLWPTQTANPHLGPYHTQRDLVGELTDAVRAEGMRMGLYYSGGLDWTFSPGPIQDFADLHATIPQDDAYVEYADGHWRELFERYQPSVMWNDIGHPAGSNLSRLFSDYYAAVPDGVINDRFRQAPEPAPLPWSDFLTTEYTEYDEIQTKKWEACRGIGFSFGYNRNEDEATFISVPELIHYLVDVVSKNGNVLLNVGPMADGAIQDGQLERLAKLGEWLAINGEAIYDTQPWVTAEGSSNEGKDVRFTVKGDTLYATMLRHPPSRDLTLRDLHPDEHSQIHLLGHDAPLDWRQDDQNLILTLPEGIAAAPAHSFSITPAPQRHAR